MLRFKKKKIKKNTGDIIILHLCNKNLDDRKIQIYRA